MADRWSVKDGFGRYGGCVGVFLNFWGRIVLSICLGVFVLFQGTGNTVYAAVVEDKTEAVTQNKVEAVMQDGAVMSEKAARLLAEGSVGEEKSADSGKATDSLGLARVSKYVCNVLVALIAAMLINFVAVILSSQMRRTSDSEILEHTLSYFENKDPDAKYVSSMETPRTNGFLAIFKALAKNPLENWHK
ncbi:MAG: hypothetical protein IJ794_16270 [Lachnospiraceae bacterium]|nr:hypothetical protein [Lachnospiraceae bacterium]